MKKSERIICFLTVIVIIFGISACCLQQNRIDQKELYQRIGEAQTRLDDVKNMKESYSDEFQQAEEKLNVAKLAKCNRDQGYSDATKSLEISKRISLKDVKKKAEKHIETIKEKGKFTSLNDLIPKLEKIIKDVNALEIDQQSIPPERYSEIHNEFKGIDNTIIGIGEEKIEGDISFDKGKYRVENLTAKGKQKLENTANNILKSVNALRERNPNKNGRVAVHLDVEGYTDTLPFTHGSLIQDLENAGNVPKNPADARRKALNKNLSKFRADTISKYIKQLLKNKNSNLHIQDKTIGYGEFMPDNSKYVPHPPHPEDDSRRRICIIYSYCRFD